MTLNTPILWILLPVLIAVITMIFRQRHVLTIAITSVTAFGLALLAFFFPENLTIILGPFELIFTESLAILGREITVEYEILPLITLIYAMTGLWTVSSGVPGVTDIFRPISLIITALLTAAMGVQPFLYAALFIQSAVLVSIPILSSPEKETNSGILRYLSLQTLAMPFILLAGWLLTGVETLPPDSDLVGQTMIVLGLGFGLLLAIFPFHSWVPMVSQNSHPTAFSYMMFILPTTILIFGLNFLDRYSFLRTSQALIETLRLIGTLMIVLGGIWTIYQDDLKRAFGFSVLSETGFSILALGMVAQGGLQWMIMLMPVRALGFWLWGHTLALIETKTKSLKLENIRGFARRYPVIALGLLLAQLSVAGLPLLASFPIKVAVMTSAFANSPGLGIWIFIGNFGLFMFTFRLLANLVNREDLPEEIRWTFSEKTIEYVPILIMIAVLVTLGMLPHTILPGITDTLNAFVQLQ